jgi:hypothetical protein
MEKNIHYRGVNKSVWDAFLKIYGGGPSIARKALDIYSEEVKINSVQAKSSPCPIKKELSDQLYLDNGVELPEEEQQNSCKSEKGGKGFDIVSQILNKSRTINEERFGNQNNIFSKQHSQSQRTSKIKQQTSIGNHHHLMKNGDLIEDSMFSEDLEDEE